jgi:hypothetical protein
MGWSYNLAIMPGWQPGGSGFKSAKQCFVLKVPASPFNGDKHGRMYSTEIKDF